MYTPFSNGDIRQQEIQARNVARQRIAEAIAREIRRTDFLVDCVVELVKGRGMKATTVDQIWTKLQLDSPLNDIRLIADTNVADYPGFAPWLNGQRLTLQTKAKLRLGSELNDAMYQARFSNTIGFKPALAA